MFDLSTMSDPQLRLFELMRFHTLRTALRRKDLSVIPHLWVREEIQHAIGNTVVLRRWAEWSALARAFHTITLNSTQYFTSLITGTNDPENGKFLKQIVNGIDTFVLFQQPDDEDNDKALSRIGLNTIWIERAQDLPVGEDSYAIMKPRQGDPYLCQFFASPSLVPLIKTRGAAKRMAGGNNGAIQRRAQLVKEHER